MNMREGTTMEREATGTVRPTFLSEQASAELERDGYTIIDLLDAEQVAELHRAYEAAGAQPADPHEACIDTFFSPDLDYKAHVHQEVERVMAPALETHLDRQHALSFSFANKWPGENSSFGLHQDISVVDETKHRSVEVWCPLVDTNEENGQLWVVPGSHKWRSVNRPIHRDRPPFWGVKERIVARHSVPIPLRAGQAIVFDHATYHFSYANRSDQPRLTAVCDLRPDEADHVHYVRPDGSDEINVYSIADSFWVDVNPFNVFDEVEKFEMIDTVEYDVEPITDADLDQFVAEGRAVDHEPVRLGPINPTAPWCHRCGSVDDVDGEIDAWLGNATLVCTSCTAAEDSTPAT